MIRKMIAISQRSYFINRYGERDSLWLPAFLEQIRFIASLHPNMIVLREKDLELNEYISLADQVRRICEAEGCEFGVHFYPEALTDGKDRYLHLPLWKLLDLQESGALPADIRIGTSVHSVQDALDAVQAGASLLFAGNIYETECKKGLAGRGLDFLHSVSAAVSVPVYGIGGISFRNMPEILSVGAEGGCMMSGFMALTEADLSSIPLL